MTPIRKDLISSVGSLQVCAGHEQAVNRSYMLYIKSMKKNQMYACIAFSSVDRNTFVHNIEVICPSYAKYVRNHYNLPSCLFIIGGGEIQSTQWTTQGDPTAMTIYAIALILLILIIVDL